MSNQVLFISLVFLLIFSMLGVVSAEINLSDPLAYERYIKIVNDFNKTDWVPVIIEVFSEDMREGAISSLSESEFRSLRREPTNTIFSGEITKKGLDKLVNNSNVRTINLEEVLSTAEVEPDVLDALNSAEWVTIFVNYMGDIEVTPENEKEMIIYYMNITIPKTLFGYIPETEMRITFAALSARLPSFEAMITKEGLEKLVNDPAIEKINLDRMAVAFNDENESEQNKKTDLGLLKGTRISLWLWITITIILIILICIIIKKIGKKK